MRYYHPHNILTGGMGPVPGAWNLDPLSTRARKLVIDHISKRWGDVVNNLEYYHAWLDEERFIDAILDDHTDGV